jgi:hypothetical protein
MNSHDKIIQIIILFILCITGGLGLVGHAKTQDRLEELKQLQLEKIEKEKYIIGYWVMNSRTCQYEYEVKI